MHGFDHFLLTSTRIVCEVRMTCLLSASTGGRSRSPGHPTTVRLGRPALARRAADFSRFPSAGSRHSSSTRQTTLSLHLARCVTYSIIRVRIGLILPFSQIIVLCAQMRLSWRDKAICAFLLKTTVLSYRMASNACF